MPRGRPQLPGKDDLFTTGLSWHAARPLAVRSPDQGRFPLNTAGATVRAVVWPDLVASERPLLVAGYSSVPEIVALLAAWGEGRSQGQIRLLLGTEPFTPPTRTYGPTRAAFTAEARRYWTEERGISLRLSAQLVRAIGVIDEGKVLARYLHGPRLHAKIYVGDAAATLGSSNFTPSGLGSQVEANARFTKAGEVRRYRELVAIADAYWEAGEDWLEDFRALLESLLQVVTWQEALARASAELLEGEWAARYLDTAITDVTLWPSQRSGIAQALWLVQQVGNVLVADATGSGKTRMGAQLVRAIRDHLWRSGRVRRDLVVLVCPPGVKATWEREAIHCGLPITAVSHGHLSRPADDASGPQHRAVQRAQILAIDEAHNYLNRDSIRTQRIRQSVADHVVLFTATPISRGAADLLRLVALLGPDNFDDDTLEVLGRLDRQRDAILSDEEISRLRTEIQRFTLRRTKSQINDLVDADPEAYVHPETGRVCRFPRNDPRLYDTGESDHDEQAAARIRDATLELHGIAQLPRHIAVPSSLRLFVTDEQWLRQRLAAARGLAVHNVLNAMRSSRAAITEHLSGTAAASQMFGLTKPFKPDDTGNVLHRVHDFASGSAPTIELDCAAPAWLIDESSWQDACAREAHVYASIFELTRELSSRREDNKVELLRRLLDNHERVLAFDRYLITLAALRERLAETLDPSVHLVAMATGVSEDNRRRLARDFGPGSDVRGVALCSDAMSEGLNLQGASCLVHLDLPTTVRAAEQRVGRVDRMDSAYDTVEIWWPNDGPAFATRAAEQLTVRAEEAERLLGSNLSLPEFTPRRRGEDLVDVHRLATSAPTEPAQWDGIRDALEPVRELVTGPTALVAPPVYAVMRESSERVISRVSLVEADRPWAFFAVRGNEIGAPRWLLVSVGEPPALDLHDVVTRLRAHLASDPPSRSLDDGAIAHLDQLLHEAARAEQSLVPRRLQRSLEQMQQVVAGWAEAARKTGDWDAEHRWRSLAGLCPRPGDDVDLRPEPRLVAERWAQLVAPLLDRHRATRRRVPYVLLRDITAPLLAAPLPLADVEAQFADLTISAPFAERVSACIVGVPGPSG